MMRFHLRPRITPKAFLLPIFVHLQVLLRSLYHLDAPSRPRGAKSRAPVERSSGELSSLPAGAPSAETGRRGRVSRKLITIVRILQSGRTFSMPYLYAAPSPHVQPLRPTALPP